MSNAKAGHPKFYEVRKENEDLYAAKHYQYATDADPMSNFRLCGQLIHKLLKPGVDPTLAAALTLMSKQIVGVYEIVGESKTGTIESLRDKFRDVEIYSSICQVLLDEKQPEKPVVGIHRCAWCGEEVARWRSEEGRFYCDECARGVDCTPLVGL